MNVCLSLRPHAVAVLVVLTLGLTPGVVAESSIENDSVASLPRTAIRSDSTKMSFAKTIQHPRTTLKNMPWWSDGRQSLLASLPASSGLYVDSSGEDITARSALPHVLFDRRAINGDMAKDINFVIENIYQYNILAIFVDQLDNLLKTSHDAPSTLRKRTKLETTMQSSAASGPHKRGSREDTRGDVKTELKRNADDTKLSPREVIMRTLEHVEGLLDEWSLQLTLQQNDFFPFLRKIFQLTECVTRNIAFAVFQLLYEAKDANSMYAIIHEAGYQSAITHLVDTLEKKTTDYSQMKIRPTFKIHNIAKHCRNGMKSLMYPMQHASESRQLVREFPGKKRKRH